MRPQAWGVGNRCSWTPDPFGSGPFPSGLSTELTQGALVTPPSLSQGAPTLPRGTQGHRMGLMPKKG